MRSMRKLLGSSSSSSSDNSDNKLHIQNISEFNPLISNRNSIPLVKLTRCQNNILILNTIINIINLGLLIGFVVLFVVKIIPFVNKVDTIDLDGIDDTIDKINNFLNSSTYKKIDKLISDLDLSKISSYSHKFEKIIDWGCSELPIDCNDTSI